MGVNTELISRITTALDGMDAAGLAAACVDFGVLSGIKMGFDLYNWLVKGRNPHEVNLDWACKIECVWRHNGGRMLDSGSMKELLQRFVPPMVGGIQEKRCSTCQWLGHNKTNCPK